MKKNANHKQPKLKRMTVREKLELMRQTEQRNEERRKAFRRQQTKK